ncbi:MAG: uracil-DNA glycosylase [Vicingaceae bacterium]|nr:uracil-DNA glycosylase [Vicingaceae bacterium]
MTLSVQKSDWNIHLNKEFSAAYFVKLRSVLHEEKSNFIVYPPENTIFNAFNITSFAATKVVIIGQDPYHGEGQAHGLSFSVLEGVKIPPSLKNIFKELNTDLGLPIPTNGNLSSWAKQGVLLLNTTLTVRKGEPNSHQKLGWEIFTDAVIKTISAHKKGVVFLLWGKFAQQKADLIDSNKHFVLKAAHPSPFSAHNGFFGCKHFSKTNELLKKQGLKEIDWEITYTN